MTTPDDDEAYFLELRRRAKRQQRIARTVPLVFAAVAACAALYVGVPWWRRHARRARLLAAAQREATSRPHRTGDERIYGELLPQWLVARQYVGEDDDSARASGEALAALRAEVADDPPVRALVDQLAALVAAGPMTNAPAIFEQVHAWNAHLERAGRPFRLDGWVHDTGRRTLLVLNAYRVAADAPVHVGTATYRARTLVRVDGTNVRESQLGHTSNDVEGALALVDRTCDFAVATVWPLLANAALSPPDPLGRAHAARVRAEARAALRPAVFATLEATATDRLQLAATARAINARAACGSTFRVVQIPWRGLSPRDQLSVLATAEDTPSSAADCPPVTMPEVDALFAASEHLAATPGLADAVGALASWVVRGVLVHEARHAADVRASGGIQYPLECPGCPPDLAPAARGELSAYLASFAAPGTAFVSLLQACEATAGMRGAHARAMDAAAAALLPGGCAQAPPDDLAGRARALEQQLFGRSEPVVLPANFDAPLLPQ